MSAPLKPQLRGVLHQIVRARLAGRLRALADAVERAPLERLADASPVMAGTVDQLVRRAPRLLGFYLNLATPEPGDDIATGPVAPRFVMRDETKQ